MHPRRATPAPRCSRQPRSRRHRMRVTPWATALDPRLGLKRIQRRVLRRVPDVHPRHATAHLLGVGIEGPARHAAQRSFVAITALGPSMALQPDVQYIVHPNTDPSLKNALNLLLRFELSCKGLPCFACSLRCYQSLPGSVRKSRPVNRPGAGPILSRHVPRQLRAV